MFREDKNLIRDGLLKAQKKEGSGEFSVDTDTGVVVGNESNNSKSNNIRLNSNTAEDIENAS